MVNALRANYSDLNAFVNAYNPTKLMDVNTDTAVTTEKSPYIVVVEKTYGDGSAAVWLMQVLSVFNEYCGKREKMDDWQIEGLAKNIVRQFGDLKASEIMLFLNRYANGHYGPLYGTVDPTDLMYSLKEKFIPWRARIIQKEEDERQWKERESWAKNALKPDEIRKLKERINKINENVTKK